MDLLDGKMAIKSIVDDDLSSKMANMAILSSFLIVAMHAFSMAFVPNSYSTTWWVYKLFKEPITDIAVPYFFCAASFFLSGHIGTPGWYKEEVHKRIKTLVVPFFLWVLIGLLIKIPATMVLNVVSGIPTFQGIDLNVLALLKRFGFTLDPPDPTILWFVRALLFFVLMSPVIALCIRKLGILVPVGLLVINYILIDIVGEACIYKFLGFFFSINGLSWFSVGMWMRLGTKLGWRSLCSKKVVVVAWTILVGVMIVKIEILKAGLYVPITLEKLMIPIALLAIWSILPSQRLPRWLTTASFPVYLLHPFLFYFIYGLMRVLHCDKLVVQNIWCYFFVVSFVFIMAITIVNLMRRFIPSVAKVLFGGR